MGLTGLTYYYSLPIGLLIAEALTVPTMLSTYGLCFESIVAAPDCIGLVISTDLVGFLLVSDFCLVKEGVLP